MNLPVISGKAGIGELVEMMHEPSYLQLLGKAVGTGMGVGILARRLPPQVAMPLALLGGIYIGLEMAAWMEKEAQAKEGPVLDATVVDAPALETEGSDLA